MSQEFLAVLEYMEKEKGISKDEMLNAVKSALISAARRGSGTSQDIRVDMNPKTGQIRAFASMRVVEKAARNSAEEISLIKAKAKDINAQIGDVIEVELPTKELGRIAAQVFKQSINQNIRSIEKNMIFDEFKDREGDIVTGVVRRFERQDVLIDLGKFEALMPARERVPTEDYASGDRIRALILKVDNSPRGPMIIVSRSHPKFVRRLFELEVSELHDGTVEIKGLAREAGYRTKIAVASVDEKIDAVGACVGLRGSRVKNIVRELNNEKIDLFRWSDDVRELVIEALKPAKLRNLEIDEDNRSVKVTVDDENLSIAIGRRGQNARLTSKLTGWNIDIQKEEIEIEGFEQKLAKAAQALAKHLKIEADTAEYVIKAGFGSIEGLCEAAYEDLQEAMPDLDVEMIEKIKDHAHKAQSALKS